jgi:Apea-like HEPN
VTSIMNRLTEDNQGYWDRIKRAQSWVKRAQEMESIGIDDENPSESQIPFITYWIAFNALYGRVNESGNGRYLRLGDDDARWFLRMICDLDAGAGLIESAVAAIRKEGHALLKSRYLSEKYWRQGYSANLKRQLEEETTAAEDALDSGDPYPYLYTLLWCRVRVLRNQIFHGCSTNRDSLNKDVVEPALRVLSELISLFVKVMENRIDKENEWPRIPFPRRGSPQHSNDRSNNH